MMTEPIEETQPKENVFSWLGLICIGFAIVFIFTLAIQWNLVEVFTPFLAAPLILCLWSIFLILAIASIIYIPLKFNRNRIKAFLPFTINMLVFLIAWFVPFTSIWLDIKFQTSKAGYEEVIVMVEDGRLQPGQFGYVNLPIEYQYLSSGGRIKVDMSDGVTSVFFFTFLGVLDNYSGYMYRSDGTSPPQGLFGDWAEIVQKQPDWFFCSSR